MAAAGYCSLKPRYSTYSTYSRVRVRVAGEKRGDRKRKRAGWLLDGLESRPTEGGEHIPSLTGMCGARAFCNGGGRREGDRLDCDAGDRRLARAMEIRGGEGRGVIGAVRWPQVAIGPPPIGRGSVEGKFPVVDMVGGAWLVGAWSAPDAVGWRWIGWI